jgi:hypothetical protein
MRKLPLFKSKLETKKVIDRIKLRKNYSNKVLEESNLKFMNKIKVIKGQELDYTPINSNNGIDNTTSYTSESSPTSPIHYIQNYALNKIKLDENISKIIKGQWKKKLDLEEELDFMCKNKCNELFDNVINYFNNENKRDDDNNILDIVKNDYLQRLNNFKNNKLFNDIFQNSIVENLNENNNSLELFINNDNEEIITQRNNILKKNNKINLSIDASSINSIDENNNNFRDLVKQQINKSNQKYYQSFTKENKSSSSSITVKSFNTDSICESSESFDLFLN